MIPASSDTPLAQGRRPRWGVVAIVLLIHVVVVAGLVRAFTPDLAEAVVRTVTQAFTVTVSTPPPPTPPPTSPAASATPREEGAAGAAGRKAEPRDAAVPRAKVVVKPTEAPPVAGKGRENASGASERGEGSGGAAAGTGTGAGGSGQGAGGGGGGSPTVKIAGDINSAKDYPRSSRDLRIGASVTIDLTVGVDGRVSACRVVVPSADPDADRITCRLATKRFRFRPALDSGGNPVIATYRWRQRWFY